MPGPDDDGSRYYVLGDDHQVTRVSLQDYIAHRKNEPMVRRVALDTVRPEPDLVFVSTVFLGIDHSYRMGGGPPILFETMAFGGPLDQSCCRYATYEGAVAGHAVMLERVKVALTAHGEAAFHVGGEDALDAIIGEDDGQ